MTLFGLEKDGQTPLTEEEKKGLIPKHLTTRNELDEYEATNIADAHAKYLFGKKKWDVTDDLLLKKIHKVMLGRTWKWAGQYRAHETSPVGAWPEQISTQVREACQSLGYWTEHKTYDAIECAVRFHFELVRIHPFPNGNGRHARLAANIYLRSQEHILLPWGGKSIVGDDTVRDQYLVALRKVDADKDFCQLMAFAKLE